MRKSFPWLRVNKTLLAIILPALFLACWYSPILNVPIRLVTIATGFLILSGSIILTWKIKWLRWTLFVVYTALTAFILSPSRHPYDRTQLRNTYCQSLQSYLGSHYVWGGEGRFGIDCSGLVRRGMEDAMVHRGFAEFNPALVRQGALLWWQDTTAHEIGHGYGGRTHFVTSCKTLNILDYSLLQPGDMAVTTSGVHIMAYLGNKRWIAADPEAMNVVTFDIPEMHSGFFAMPMNIVRWKILDDQVDAGPN